MTLGVQDVIGPDESEAIYEAIRASTTEEVEIKHKKKLQDHQKMSKDSLRARDERINHLQTEHTRLGEDVRDLRAGRRKAFERSVRQALDAEAFVHRSAKIALGVVVPAVFLGSAAFAGSPWNAALAWGVAIVSTIVFVYALWNLGDRWLQGALEGYRNARFQEYLGLAQTADLEKYADVDWDTGRVKWHGIYDSGSEFQNDRLL